MGLLTPIVGFATAVSIGTWIQLLIAIGVVALMYLATGRIITRPDTQPCGYSCPSRRSYSPRFASSFFGTTSHDHLWWIHRIHRDFHRRPFLALGPDQFSRKLRILHRVRLYSLASIRGQHSPDTDGPRQQGFIGRGPSAPASGPMTPSDPVNVVRSMPASPGGPGPRPIPGDGPAVVASAPPAKRPVGKSCAWCGEALPGNRALFHDCGPKDRPEVFCKKCGNALSAEPHNAVRVVPPNTPRENRCEGVGRSRVNEYCSLSWRIMNLTRP